MNPVDENQEQNYVKPFSIRQYTLSCRQKNIFHCWPFPDKYLLLCMKHGVNNVLPPLHPPRNVIQSSEDVGHLINSIQKDNKDNPIVKNDAGPVITEESAGKGSNNSRQICHLSGISHDVSSDMLGPKRQTLKTTPHSFLDVDKQPIWSLGCSRTSKKNDRRRKGKQKKRWMVDILAVAKPCSLEDIYKMNRENSGTNAAVEKGLRGESKLTAIVDHGCNSELEEECSNQKLGIHGFEEGYSNLLGQNKWVLQGQIHRLQIQFVKLESDLWENCKIDELN